MKTLVDVWVLRSGEYYETFGDKMDAIQRITDSEFLEYFPENTVFTLQPGYVLVTEEPKHNIKPKRVR